VKKRKEKRRKKETAAKHKNYRSGQPSNGLALSNMHKNCCQQITKKRTSKLLQ